jgi:hypothetical protein
VQRECGAMDNIKVDPDKAKLWLDDQMLDRIIAAVGKTPVKPDRDTLRCDLLDCYGRYSIATAPQHFKRQANRLSSIQKHAKRLVELLEADAADFRVICGEWPKNLLLQLKFLVESIEAAPGMHSKPADIAERTKARLGASGSALQSLTSQWLPEVYSKHFGKGAGRSRNKDYGTLGGPYIRFVHLVLVEFKIECSDETVARVLHMGKS